ncbi:hypothetical protein [Roseovarius ramblicola]|uniref:Uncharacterized protein n=1 Tax=Roseovarius ramblicola TaxID=2022336 RepID=A0ABV5HWH9_9RHOB
MTTGEDMVKGAKVLVGDENWRKGPVWLAFWAFLFGRRERFEHLDMRCTIAWWRDKPYLVSIREARP